MKGFAYLLKLEADQNHNRYYRMVQEGDRFKIEMGRIGARPVCMIRPMTLWDTTYQKKIKEGYEDRSEFCDVSVEKNQNYKPIPESVVAELMEYIKGPDFPTAATIIGLNDIKQAYETGRGSIKMQAVANF